MDVQGLKEIVAAIWAYDGVRLIVVGVILNLLLAVAVAIRTASFSFRVLGEFLWRQLLPFVIVYYAAKLFADATDWAWIAPAVLVLIGATLTGAIVEKLKQLGVPIPDTVMRLFDNASDVEWRKYAYIDKREDAAMDKECEDDGRG